MEKEDEKQPNSVLDYNMRGPDVSAIGLSTELTEGRHWTESFKESCGNWVGICNIKWGLYCVKMN